MKRLFLPLLFLLITLTAHADNDVAPPTHRFYIPIVTRAANPKEIKPGYAWNEMNEDQTAFLHMKWYHHWRIKNSGGAGRFSEYYPHFSCDVLNYNSFDNNTKRWLFQDLRSLGNDYRGVLVFLNEPDLTDQCNRTPSHSVYMYEKVLEIAPNAIIIGPQVSHFDYQNGWAWLREWLGYVEARGLRMPDYIGIHEYNDNAGPALMLDSLFVLLATFPDAPTQGYVTEFGTRSPAVLRIMLAEFQADDRIVAYAWFDPEGKMWSYAALIDEDGELTELGEVWVEMH